MKKTLLATAVFAASTGIATAQSAPSFTGMAAQMEIDNTCIIRFNDSVSRFDVEGKARGMLTKAQAQAKHLYKNAIKGMAVNMSCAKAKTVFANESDVMRFTEDGIAYASPAKKVSPVAAAVNLNKRLGASRVLEVQWMVPAIPLGYSIPVLT